MLQTNHFLSSHRGPPSYGRSLWPNKWLKFRMKWFWCLGRWFWPRNLRSSPICLEEAVWRSWSCLSSFQTLGADWSTARVVFQCIIFCVELQRQRCWQFGGMLRMSSQYKTSGRHIDVVGVLNVLDTALHQISKSFAATAKSNMFWQRCCQQTSVQCSHPYSLGGRRAIQSKQCGTFYPTVVTWFSLERKTQMILHWS